MSLYLMAKTKLANKPNTVRSLEIRPVSALIVFSACALLLAACGGSRPEFADADDTTDLTTIPLVSSTAPVVGDALTATPLDLTVEPDRPLELTDCITVVGPGPWPVVIEAEPEAATLCGRVAGHHRILYTNSTTETVSFDLAGQPISIEPGAQLLTEPLGTLTQPGLLTVNADPYAVTSPWLIEPSQAIMQSYQFLLGKFGPIEVGMTPVEVETILGGNGLAKTEATGCQLSYLLGDPYSPLLTVRDGKITAIQSFAPGQQTRSGIGVGSTEAEIQTAYGENIVTEPSPSGDANQKLMVFVPTDDADKANRIVFDVNSGVVTSLRTGLTETIVISPRCPSAE